MISQQQIVLTPIGYVKTEAVGNEVKDKSRISKIVLNPELVAFKLWTASKVFRTYSCSFGSAK